MTLYSRFVRWRKAGVWDGILAAVSEAYDGDIVMIDSSCVRVHQHGAAGKGGFGGRRRGSHGTRFFNRIQHVRGLAIHHDRSPDTFLAALEHAVIRIWLAAKWVRTLASCGARRNSPPHRSGMQNARCNDPITSITSGRARE